MPPKKQQVNNICNSQKLFKRLSADMVCDTSHLSIESALDSLYQYGQFHGHFFHEKFFPKQNSVKSRVVSQPRNLKRSHSGISPVTERYRTSSADRRLGSRNGTSGRDIGEESVSNVRRKVATSRQQQLPQPTCSKGNSSKANPTDNYGRNDTIRSDVFLGVTVRRSVGGESSVAGSHTKEKGVTGSPSQTQFEASVVVCGRTVSLGVYPTAVEAAKAHDRALIRATGPSHCPGDDLNFDVELYSRDPLERFSEHDGALKRQLFGSNWMGPRPCDFGFLIAHAKENKLGIGKARRRDTVSATPSALPSQNGAMSKELPLARNCKRDKGSFCQEDDDDDEPKFKCVRRDSASHGDADSGSSSASSGEEEEEPPPPLLRIGSVIEVLLVSSGEMLRGVMLERRPGGGWMRVGFAGGDTKFHRGPLVWTFPPRCTVTAGPVLTTKEKMIRCVPASEASETDLLLARLFSVTLLYGVQPLSALGVNEPSALDALISRGTSAGLTIESETSSTNAPTTPIDGEQPGSDQSVEGGALEAVQQQQQIDQYQCVEVDTTENDEPEQLLHGGGHHITSPICEYSGGVVALDDGTAIVATPSERMDCATGSDSGSAIYISAQYHYSQLAEITVPVSAETALVTSSTEATTTHNDSSIRKGVVFSLPSFQSVFSGNADGVSAGRDSIEHLLFDNTIVTDRGCLSDADVAPAVTPLVEVLTTNDPVLAVSGSGEQFVPPSEEVEKKGPRTIEPPVCTPSPATIEPEQPTLIAVGDAGDFTGDASVETTSVGESATCALGGVAAVTVSAETSVVTPPRAFEEGAIVDSVTDEECCYWVAESDCDSEQLADNSMVLELIGRAPRSRSSSEKEQEAVAVMNMATRTKSGGGQRASEPVSDNGSAVRGLECFTIGITVESVAAILVASASQQNVDIYATFTSAVTNTSKKSGSQPRRQSNGRFTRA